MLLQIQPNLDDKIIIALDNLAKTQNTHGEWSVNGAAYIVSSLIILLGVFIYIYINSKQQAKKDAVRDEQHQILFNKLLDNSTNEKLNATLSEIQEILKDVKVYLKDATEKISEESKLECTVGQVHIVIKSIIKKFNEEITYKTNTLLLNNHIEEKERIENRIKELIESEHESLILELNNFKYNGKRLSELLDNSFIDRKIKICMEYIYGNDQLLNKINVFHDKLDVIFKDMFNRMKKSIDSINIQNGNIKSNS